MIPKGIVSYNAAIYPDGNSLIASVHILIAFTGSSSDPNSGRFGSFNIDNPGDTNIDFTWNAYGG